MTRREKIIEIIEDWLHPPTIHGDVKVMTDNIAIESIADEILALPLDIPTRTQIENKAIQYSGNDNSDFSKWMNHDFTKGVEWMRDEIMRRNVSSYKDSVK